MLAATGYRQYEASAYARDDKACRHNMNYWLFGDYLGVGAGAHGKISDANDVFRYSKPANPLQYMKTIESGDYDSDLIPITKAELVFEFMLNALRLTGGFRESDFCERTGLSAADLVSASEGACAKGLISRDDHGRWQPTALGRRFLNDLQAEFLPDSV